jgi:hypothetical protein
VSKKIAALICLMLLLVGCNFSQGTPLPMSAPVGSAPGGATNAGTTTAPASLPPATQRYLYVVHAGRDLISTLVFPLTALGSSAPLLEFPGSQVSLNGAGNIYVLDQKNYPTFAVTSINVYAPNSPTGKPLRSLPVGPGTKISAVYAMVASAAGESFVNDGKGIAVFSPTATGDDDPVRYIQDLGEGESAPVIWSRFMVVDNSGNLHVGNDGDKPIVVFGPKDTGAVVPSRAISGPLTHLGRAACDGGYGIFGMGLDDSGNLYVLYRCMAGLYPAQESLTVYEFGPTANGNVAPIRSVTTSGLGIYHAGSGLAVDSAGTIYVSASYGTAPYSFMPAVIEFSATASGTVSPSNIVTSSAWPLLTPPAGSDDWFDPSGSIAVH